MTGRMPSFFIPHGGGPCFFMDWEPAEFWKPMEYFLRDLAGTLPASPRAILLISAHWEAPQFMVGSHPQPELIYDYYGFPPHTYQLSYPAPGDPALAERILALLGRVGIVAGADPVRGFDHGAFVPLKVMFPEARIPVVQLSLRNDHDPASHITMGAALAPLRDEGVLIIGSGMSFHNMGVFRDQGRIEAAAPAAKSFDRWLRGVVEAEPTRRNAELRSWREGPDAEVAHPAHHDEHLLPLMVAAGAAEGDRGQTVFNDNDKPLPVSGFRFG